MAIVTTALPLLGLIGLLSLRFVGLYSHRALSLVLLLGLGWSVASRAWLAWKDRLHRGLLHGFRARENRPHLLRAVRRASFWTVAAVACLAVFPRPVDMTPLIALLAGASLFRVGASFLDIARHTNAGPTLVMAAGALILAFDLGRAVPKPVPSPTRCACASVKPGKRSHPAPSITVAPGGGASSPAAPIAGIRSPRTSTVRLAPTCSLSMATTLTFDDGGRLTRHNGLPDSP